MNMERVQHHVALAGNDPALKLAFFRREHRLVHIKGFTVDLIRIVEIEPAFTVLHVAHIAVVHFHTAVSHHVAMIHSTHRLIAVFLHQCLHAHHVEHRVHRKLELALGQAVQRRQRGHFRQRIRQRTRARNSDRLDV